MLLTQRKVTFSILGFQSLACDETLKEADSRAAVYRITPEPGAPRLTVHSHEMGVFDGALKGPLSPKAPFLATVTEKPSSPKQFYAFAPGVLAIPDDAMHDEALYYCCTLSCEMLGIKTEHGYFVGLNPDFVWGNDPRALDQMSDADWLSSFPDTGCPNIIRIGLEPTDLFCTRGVGKVEGDDFMFIYEQGGYRGLRFELVWQERG